MHSEPLSFVAFSPFFASSISPSTVHTSGNVKVTINGTNFASPSLLSISCRIVARGDKEFSNCNQSCTYISTTQITCFVPPHDIHDQVKVQLSADLGSTFFPVLQYMVFEACGEREGTKGYLDPCEVCPPGTFKDSPGNRPCSECAQNFYQPLQRQTSCLRCPRDTVTRYKVTTKTALFK